MNGTPAAQLVRRLVDEVVNEGRLDGPWLGHPPTGRRFVDVAELYVFHLRDGRIAGAWGLEDTYGRLRQLGLLRDEAS